MKLRVTAGLYLMVLLPFSIARAAENGQSIPRLVVPPPGETELPPGVIRQVGSSAFRHHGIAPASFSRPEPFFSPDGETVYVPGNFGLMAFDTATGRMRFHYQYGSLNLAIQDEGTDGIRVNFAQGPLAGQFVRLEHSTGKELARGKQLVVAGSQVEREFSNGQRAVLQKTAPRDNRRQQGPTTFVLFDVPNQKNIAELGSRENASGIAATNFVASADRRWLASCANGAELQIVSLDDGNRLRTVLLSLRTDQGEQTSPVWSRDGKTVYTWRRQQGAAEIIALEVETGDIRVLFQDRRKMVHSAVVVSPDGALLAYQQDDNPWKQNSYWKILKLADLSEAHVVDVRPANTEAAFSPDSKSFWLLSPCGLARYDLATGKIDPLSSDPLAPTQALAFSEDGTRLRGVAGAEVITWDVATGKELEPRTGFNDAARTQASRRCIYVSPDGRRTLWSGNSQIQALVDGRKVGEFYAANMKRLEEYELSANHQTIVHDAYFGELKVANLWTGETLHELMPRATPRQDYALALAPDQRTLAVFHRDYQKAGVASEVTIELWDIERAKQTGRVQQQGDRSMTMQFSQDSRELRVVHRGEMTVWDVASQTLVRQRKVRLGAISVHDTPNRHWQLRLGHASTGTVQWELVDIHSGQTVRSREFPRGTHISALAFSPDRLTLAVAVIGETVRLYHFYEPRPEAKALLDQSNIELVNLLGGEDVSLAWDALCLLIQRGDACLPELSKAVSRQAVSLPLVAEWISKLDDQEYAVREAATRKLLAAPAEIAPRLREELAEGGSQEKLARLKRILQHHRDGSVARERLLTWRVCEVLAAIHTPQARAVLEQLAARDARIPVTAEANATLRLAKE